MPHPRHDILTRQLKRYLGGPDAVPPEWGPFLQAVNDAYREFDMDRSLLERSLELSSEELIQANADLRQSETRYRTFIDATSDLVFLKDDSFRHLFINKAYRTFLGKPDQAVIGTTDFDLMPKEAAEHCRATDQEALAKNGSLIAEEILGTNTYQSIKFPVPLPGGRIGVGGYIRDITERKRLEAVLEQRLVALTRPLDQPEGITFEELFDLAAMQRLQDEFAAATGVASIITQTDGTPITRPSHFCRLCNDIIRCTETGRLNCYRSDAVLGRFHPDGPVIQPCLSGGLWDAGASITVGDRHLANWLIGQVRDETQSEEKMRTYARTIGADETAAVEAYRQVPAMSLAQFQKVAQALFTLANQLSTTAYQNVQQARFITDRKRAERMLKESEERFKQVSESAGEWIWEMDAEGRYTYSSQVVERILGYKPEELVGKIHFYELFAPHVREEIRKAATERLVRKESFHKLSNPVLHKDGHIVILETSGMPILDQEGHLIGYRGADTDITERRQTEEHLRFHAQLLDSVTESIVATNLEGRILYWGRGAEKLYGYTAEEVLNQPYRNFAGSIESPDEELFRQKIIATGFWRGEHRQKKRNGEVVWTSTFISLVKDEQNHLAGFLGIDQDITERKKAELERAKLEDELQQTRKMEAVGRLAGGIAHDFNNMLGVILGRAEMALEQVNPDHPIHEDLEEIQKAASRSADLTRQLLAFARKQTAAPKILDLNQTVAGMLQMLRRLIGENIVLDWQPHAELWPVKVDPSQIDQILANLCVNARAAIVGIGKITIQTWNVFFDETACANHAGLLPGEFVRLTVTDTGSGMTQETLDHIFEPFFTTKEVGEGTGLGLATIYGIVKQNKGCINVTSHLGQGSTFDIYLPRHVGQTESLNPKDPKTPTARGTETILLVEDETSILTMTARMLTTQGYTVLMASTPSQAIQLARNHTGKVHLLMTDVVMPEMNGRDLAITMQSLHPEIKLLFMSGYTADVIAHNGVLEEGMHFIQKPFVTQALALLIRHALDSKKK